jgi:hypothetical protein
MLISEMFEFPGIGIEISEKERFVDLITNVVGSVSITMLAMYFLLKFNDEVQQKLKIQSEDYERVNQHLLSSNNTKTKAVVTAPPDGVSVEVWDSFIAIRKAKRAPMTTVALEGIQREAAKAGVSLEEALATCCTRGWQSFKASWTVEQVTESQRAREHMAELTRGMATPKPKNFWEKTIDETNEVIHVETKRLL